MFDLKLVLGISLAMIAALGIIMSSAVSAIGPPQSGACGAGDEMSTRGGNLCLPDKAGDHAPEIVPEKDDCRPLC